MAHFAKLDNNNVVVTVLVGRDDDDEIELCSRTGDNYKKTSYNTHGNVHYDPITVQPSEDQTKAFRGNFAGIGYTFYTGIGANGIFMDPKPYDSWVISTANATWIAPSAMPTDGNFYNWDEDNQTWINIGSATAGGV